MIEIKDTNFEEKVLNNDTAVIVDFWAPWCGPCKMLGPVMEELDKEHGDKVEFAKVNVDENPVVANQYRISSIPTIMIFKAGKLQETLVGFRPKAAIAQVISKYV